MKRLPIVWPEISYETPKKFSPLPEEAFELPEIQGLRPRKPSPLKKRDPSPRRATSPKRVASPKRSTSPEKAQPSLVREFKTPIEPEVPSQEPIPSKKQAKVERVLGYIEGRGGITQARLQLEGSDKMMVRNLPGKYKVGDVVYV